MTTDRESLLYRLLSDLLLYGVIASLGLMALGFALLAAQHGTGRPAWLPLWAVLPRALAGDPRGILDLGVLVLFATPSLRVVASIALFAANRERRYTLIASAVLLLLLLSVIVASKQ